MKMIQTVIISGETPSELTMRLNDWLKDWPEDKIVDVKYAVKDIHSIDRYTAMVIYKK
jgi:hypothetical protein